LLRRINEKLLVGQSLDAEDCHEFVDSLENNVSEIELAAFLSLLRKKKETPQEMSFLAKALRKKGSKVTAAFPCLDIVGTGGDGEHTYNISTTASILAAACGAKVAKHGSRASSSKCGSADLIEALGIRLDTTASHSHELLRKLGICFLFAPIYNSVLKPLVPVRKALGFRTTFNFMGPMLNPASPKYMLLGVSNPEYIPLFVETLQETGVERGFVFHGPGLDELACFGASEGVFFDGKTMEERVVDPKNLGFPTHPLSSIQGGDVEVNVRAFRNVLQGERGAFFDTVVLNAGYGLYIAKIRSTIEESLTLAESVLASGSAYELVEKWVEYDKLS